MKKHLISPVLACFSGFILGGCGQPTPPDEYRNASAPAPKATPVRAAVPRPTLQTIIIQSGKSSLPAERQMLGNRPAGQPLPTATKGIDFSKDVPISNAPGTEQMLGDRSPKTPFPRPKPRNNGLDFTKGVVISNAPGQKTRQ